MRRTVDPAEFWKGPISTEGEVVMVELDGSLSSAETLWRMVLAMALKDRAWCIQYDLGHPFKLMYVTSWQVYGLVPPPDDMADVLVRAIDRLTRPRSIPGPLFTLTSSISTGRKTRSFWVRHEGELISWVASWPRRAADGPIVVFRETFPGPDPSLPRPAPLVEPSCEPPGRPESSQGTKSETATDTAGKSESEIESPGRSVRTSE